MTALSRTLDLIRGELRDEGHLLASRLIVAEPAEPGVPGSAMAGFCDLFDEACGEDIPDADYYHLALEYIFEGYLLHYGHSRLIDPRTHDFTLLSGDYMYARGLMYISRLKDPVCIDLLADLVRICSFVHCEGLQPSLALETWAATSVCLAERAKTLARNAGDSAGVRPQPCVSESRKKTLFSGEAKPGDILEEFLGPDRKEQPRLEELIDSISRSY